MDSSSFNMYDEDDLSYLWLEPLSPLPATPPYPGQRLKSTLKHSPLIISSAKPPMDQTLYISKDQPPMTLDISKDQLYSPCHQTLYISKDQPPMDLDISKDQPSSPCHQTLKTLKDQLPMDLDISKDQPSSPCHQTLNISKDQPPMDQTFNISKDQPPMALNISKEPPSCPLNISNDQPKLPPPCHQTFPFDLSKESSGLNYMCFQPAKPLSPMSPRFKQSPIRAAKKKPLLNYKPYLRDGEIPFPSHRAAVLCLRESGFSLSNGYIFHHSNNYDELIPVLQELRVHQLVLLDAYTTARWEAMALSDNVVKELVFENEYPQYLCSECEQPAKCHFFMTLYAIRKQSGSLYQLEHPRGPKRFVMEQVQPILAN